MTRFAKHKKPRKDKTGEDATPWEALKKPVTEEEDQRKAQKRLEKKRKRELKKICFRCRAAGHSMNECTAEIPDELKQKREVKTGICYKCGSTEHRLNQCTVKGDSFAYATCFVCGKQGHWSRLCPDNPNGLYPNGGCCNECGSKQHFKRDCPTLLKKQGIDDQQLTCLTATTSNIDDNVELVTVKPIETKKKSLKRLKIVKF
ncbi:unnamed protein product [Rotaria magnacalcarata]|uniref:CCHC-type domain-containing protein n=4 Tax=Rotaria TaxID=231623 RepID=A0A816SNZ7_9BILA|nr:unnamed protein product [Rotaria magnacalcarata]CAF2230475.1 unnamed protein product [Rotaria magnacalcarata]CAF3988401.1 unnamed protein product [Rotaria magnacalcarata]CAF4424459.1 unnamed protein product [Rotaria magnacalcarata]